jgi:SAM-dependent methyltransferase
MEKLPEQQREKNREEENRERADYVLSALGLTMEDLKGKDVLDIGTGTEANLMLAAIQEGVNVVGVDAQKQEENVRGVQYIYGDFGNIHFEDESFDLIVSHAAPPLTGHMIEGGLEMYINKVKKLLRSGGEFRFGPADACGGLIEEEIFTEEEDKSFTNEQRMNRIQKKGLEVLQSIDSTIEKDMSTSRGFFILKK